MPGGWETYRCDRRPLTIELGGSTWWDESGGRVLGFSPGRLQGVRNHAPRH
jgi:hypothetical protein